ncbi:MAG: 30S ribosomal protein S6 [candidate division Zixibacteria bacterium]|nr:30S ribosomal protein S6 [candidate division Zixibacteria bacterium]MBU1472046.1 30S ribosomal protein S6 [candidate division Zixibacteria bacterium]MBU2626354.1 30S ribosomal protein S6 [candidate division Zixibacteria bacterium]
MKLYETGIILDPQLEESQFDKEIEQFESLITTNGGKIVDVNRWGIRRLAYEINKKQQGFYVFIQFEGDGTIPSKLEKAFLLNENVVRFMTVVPDWLGEDQEETRTPEDHRSSRY